MEAGTEELEKRRALASSRSPAELAQIKTIGDIPIPSTLKRMTTLKKGEKEAKPHLIAKSNSCSDLEAKEKWSIKKSLNTQCLVRSKYEDPQVQAERAALLKNKTVAELSKIHSLNEFPLASTLQQLVEGSRGLHSKPTSSRKSLTFTLRNVLWGWCKGQHHLLDYL